MPSPSSTDLYYIHPSDTPRRGVRTVQTALRTLLLPCSGSMLSRCSFYLLLANMLVMQSAHVAYMLRHLTDVATMADTCATVSTTFQGIAKITSLYYHSGEVRKMCRVVYKDFWPTYVVQEELRVSLNKLAKWSELLMISFYVLIFFCCSLLLIPPLLLGTRDLPLASIYPFNWSTSPLYEAMYVWQWLMSLYGVCFVVGTHDFLFISMMIQLIVQFRMLQQVLSQIGTKQEKEVYKILQSCTTSRNTNFYIKEQDYLLVHCVAHHIRVLDFADIVEKTFSPIVFTQFVESVSGLCLGVFLVNLVDGVNFLKLVFFTIGHFAQLLLYCLFGNEVMHQSVRVADAAFDSSWHRTFHPSVRNGLTMIIQRAQRTISMKDGGKYPLVIAKILLSSLCVWPLNKSVINRIIRYFFIINMITMVAPHAYFMLSNITDVTIVTSAGTTVSTTLQSIAKLWLLNYYSEELSTVITIMDNDFWPADIVDSAVEVSVRQGSRLIISFLTFFLSTAVISCWYFMGLDIVLGKRILPLESSLPFDWRAPPWYELLYTLQFFNNSYIVVGILTAHDFFFNALIMNCISQFKLLRGALLTIGSEEGKALNKRLKRLPHYRARGLEDDEEFELVAKCVKHHNLILDVCDKLQNIYGAKILLQFFISATALCVSSFVITKEGKNSPEFYSTRFPWVLSFSSVHLTQFFVLCTVGNELIWRSATIADGAYCSEWSNGPSARVRQGLSLLIQRAQREQCITALGFANLDYPNFVNVLRLSFSFYTLLSSIEEEE